MDSPAPSRFSTYLALMLVTLALLAGAFGCYVRADRRVEHAHTTRWQTQQSTAHWPPPAATVGHDAMQRSQDELQAAQTQASRWQALLMALGALLLFLVWKTCSHLYRVLGCTVPQLMATVRQLEKGSQADEIVVPVGRESSVLAWLAETQRKLAKLELRQFKAIVDSTDDAIISKTLTGTITSWNPGAEKLFGFTAEEALGRSMLMLIPPDRTDEETHILACVKQGQRVEHFDTVRRHKAGHLIDISATISPIKDETGHIIGASTIARDVSKRKQSEEDMRIAATAFETQDGMIVMNQDRVILRVNKAFTKITGYTAREALGQTPRLLRSHRDTEAAYEARWSALQQTGFWEGEIWHRRKNGSEYPAWFSINTVKDDEGSHTHYVSAFSDIASKKSVERMIESLAFSDMLTGLPNRRHLLVLLQQAMLACDQQPRYAALMMIDLDDFRNLNDAIGREQGDLLLQQASQRLSRVIREGDVVARVGGDEFVVLLHHLDPDAEEAANQAELIAGKVLHTLSAPYAMENVQYHSSASIGVTLFNESHSASPEDHLKHAELAMYHTRKSGSNSLSFFDTRMQDSVSARVSLEARLRHAITNQQLLLYFQVQVDKAGAMVGAEALVRWRDAERGMVSPAEFIPLAEETGLILPIGNWVLETACRQLVAWSTQPATQHLTVAVNVSAKQFYQPDFVEQVLAVLAQTGANPCRLKLELTESSLITKVEDIIAKMNALKAHGVSFSLDDFGTGYSSLSYLKRLPLDQLKIDQGFVRDILVDSNDAAIAKMVIALADSMGLDVIAEGVETTAQRDFLAELGCFSYQGYLFGRPLPIMEFDSLLQHGKA